MCSDHLSAAFMWQFLRASSLVARVSLQVVAGPDRYEVLDGSSKTHFSGDSCVFGSGVFRYWRMAHCRESMSRLPLGVVLSVMIGLTDFTPISALQCECGKATDDRRWCTPHSLRNWR